MICFNSKSVFSFACKFGRLIIFLFIFSLIPTLLLAEENTHPALNEYLQTSWTTENGLPQNSVNAIIQSHDGYLWLATFGGLVRFDGVKFTTFNSGNTPGLINNRITAIYEDKNNALWLGTENGEVMTLKDGQAKSFTLADGNQRSIVLALKETRDGTIWAATTNGLSRFENDKFTLALEGDSFSLKEDKNGSLWIFKSSGLVEYKNNQFITHNPPGEISNWLWMDLAPDDSLWFNTKSGLTNFVDGKFNTFRNPLLDDKQMPKVIFTDHEGAVWVSYWDSNAIYRFKDGVFADLQIKTKQSNLKTIFEDREGNLWLGTTGDGLIRIKKRRIATYSTANGLLNNSIHAIVGDGKDGVWASTSLGIAHLEKDKTTAYKDGFPPLNLNGLWLDRSGILWIGSPLGVFQFKDGKFTNVISYSKNADTNAIFEDRQGNIWIGNENGLNKLQEGKLQTFSQAEGLANNKVAYITETRDGALWIGTVGGVSRFLNGQFTNYTVEQGLSNNYVRDIFEESDGTIWFGTYGGGLNRLKNGEIISVTTKDGLFDDFISRILPDENGNFWMLGNQGIFRVNRQELNDFADKKINSFSTVSYNVADGMISSEGNGGNQPAGWRTPDGKLYFSTINGVAVIEPTTSNGLPPPVVIETATVERKLIPLSQKIQLNPGQGNLQIEYTGLSFTRSEQVKFKYRLVGLDNEWVYAGTRRTAYYPYLPPGEYTFEVLAENGEGLWSESPAVLKIVVNPYFWQTWWFWLLVIILIAALTLLVFRLRIRRMERAQEVQEEFAQQLINTYESKQPSDNGESETLLNELHKLTPTERHVLSLIAEDKTSKEIADQLFISYRTVERHRSNICKKLELQGSYALVKFAVANKSKL